MGREDAKHIGVKSPPGSLARLVNEDADVADVVDDAERGDVDHDVVASVGEEVVPLLACDAGAHGIAVRLHLDGTGRDGRCGVAGCLVEEVKLLLTAQVLDTHFPVQAFLLRHVAATPVCGGR